MEEKRFAGLIDHKRLERLPISLRSARGGRECEKLRSLIRIAPVVPPDRLRPDSIYLGIEHAGTLLVLAEPWNAPV